MLSGGGLHLRQGQRVGLLGGSFDPPHQGHLHISREAAKRFGLNRVIWLVSPGNPLKRDAPAKLERRIAAARDIADTSLVTVSDFEARNDTRYTADTLRVMRLKWPTVHFVWLMGADNLAQVHKWGNWHQIFATCPVGVLARPGQRIAARLSPAARYYRQQRMSGKSAKLLPLAETPRWCFVNIPMRDISSTTLRQQGLWPGPKPKS